MKVLTHIHLAFFLWDIGIQHCPRCDAALCGVPYVANLFAYRIFIDKWNENSKSLLMLPKMTVDSSK